MTGLDPLAQLRQAAENAVAKSQQRVSVNPHAVLRVFEELDLIKKYAEIKDRGRVIPHEHERTNGERYEHSHTRGDVAHGHHGARYVKPDKRPRIVL